MDETEEILGISCATVKRAPGIRPVVDAMSASWNRYEKMFCSKRNRKKLRLEILMMYES